MRRCKCGSVLPSNPLRRFDERAGQLVPAYWHSDTAEDVLDQRDGRDGKDVALRDGDGDE